MALLIGVAREHELLVYNRLDRVSVTYEACPLVNTKSHVSSHFLIDVLNIVALQL